MLIGSGPASIATLGSMRTARQGAAGWLSDLQISLPPTSDGGERQPLKLVPAPGADEDPVLEGTLLGAKGQYLIFDTAVINVRKYGGYCLSIV